MAYILNDYLYNFIYLLPLKKPLTVAAINAVVIPTDALHPELLPIVK